MNTRIQVEHPVSECITGMDLVEMQLRLAEGETRLPEQSSIKLNGHAIEVRVYAEDPATNYLPSSGPVRQMNLPQAEGIRLDQAIEQGDEISPFYDPMVAKVIVHGRSRHHAMKMMREYLAQCSIFGFRHNLPFLEALFTNEAFVSNIKSIQNGSMKTRWLSEAETLTDEAWAQVAMSLWGDKVQRKTSSGYDLNLLNLGYGEEDHWISAETLPDGSLTYYVDGREVQSPNATTHLRLADFGQRMEIALAFGVREIRNLTHQVGSTSEAEAGDQLLAPLNGKVTAIEVTAGQSVNKGDTLVVIEAMKLETPVKATRDAVIQDVLTELNQQVQQGERLVNYVPLEGEES